MVHKKIQDRYLKNKWELLISIKLHVNNTTDLKKSKT